MGVPVGQDAEAKRLSRLVIWEAASSGKSGCLAPPFTVHLAKMADALLQAIGRWSG